MVLSRPFDLRPLREEEADLRSIQAEAHLHVLSHDAPRLVPLQPPQELLGGPTQQHILTVQSPQREEIRDDELPRADRDRRRRSREEGFNGSDSSLVTPAEKKGRVPNSAESPFDHDESRGFMSLVDRAETFCSVISETLPFVSSFGCIVCVFVSVCNTWRNDYIFWRERKCGLDLDFMDGRDESGPITCGHISNKQLMIK